MTENLAHQVNKVLKVTRVDVVYQADAASLVRLERKVSKVITVRTEKTV